MQISDIEWETGFTFQALEKQLLESALAKHKFDIKATAQALGICRASVYKKTKEHFNKSVMIMRKEFKPTETAAA